MSDNKKGQLDPAIHRVRLDKIRIFEITEPELEALERGTGESLFLNFAIAVSSVAISFIIALSTTNIQSDRTFYVFVIIAVVTGLASMIFGVLWYKSKGSLKNVSNEIRSRIPPEGVQQDVSGDANK